MKTYKCRECGSDFEHDFDEEGRPGKCPDCGSADIIGVKAAGFIEFDPDEGYESGETDGDELEEDSEPGSLFDKRGADDDEDDE